VTYPGGGDIIFRDESLPVGTSVREDEIADESLVPPEAPKKKFPEPIIDISDDQKDKFIIWIDQWVEDLISDQSKKMDDWVALEEAYRAKNGPAQRVPFVGACNETVPAIAMAVDPIHARLSTGIFKQDPIIKLKGLKKPVLKFIPALERWVDYYIKHKLHLRQIASPRLLECAKLGTCAFKTVYDRQSAKIKTYNEDFTKVIEKEELRFSGPRVLGLQIGDVLFPPLYQHVQDCPIIVERIRTTYWKLKVAEASGKLANVDKIKDQVSNVRTPLESAREEASNHTTSRRHHEELEVFEVWCDYDIDGNGLPEHLVATYHRDTKTLLQLRYNWYFHQRKPYTIIPYTVTNDSLYGLGVAEMVKPFQDALTKWHRMATDNTYLSNIRMFIVKKNSGIEEVPRLYAGRCFFVDDPAKDFIPFASADIYPSTLAERQNLFGLAEKRTGVSDYLTGRESPIIGTRATATSTLALIQEGTKRVEEVLENLRVGFSEIIENCMYIWIQYGMEGLDDLVFGDDETSQLLKEFFSTVSAENVNGALAIDLSATDASGSRQATQQLQLQIIQVMMGYYEKLIELGTAAIQAQATMPAFAAMATDVMEAAKKMFTDLLTKYDIRNPEDYIPDLEKYLNGPAASAGAGQAVGGGVAGLPGGPAGLGGLSAGIPTLGGNGVPQPATPGSGGLRNGGLPFAG
jgi:hypothetical protein